MKIEVDKLREIIDSLPDPEVFNYKDYKSPILPDPTIAKFTAPYNSEPIQTIDFHLEPWKRGFRRWNKWVIDLDPSRELFERLKKQDKETAEQMECWKASSKEYERRFCELEKQFHELQGKWYVRFAYWLTSLFK